MNQELFNHEGFEDKSRIEKIDVKKLSTSERLDLLEDQIEVCLDYCQKISQTQKTLLKGTSELMDTFKQNQHTSNKWCEEVARKVRELYNQQFQMGLVLETFFPLESMTPEQKALLEKKKDELTRQIKENLNNQAKAQDQKYSQSLDSDVNSSIKKNVGPRRTT